MEPTREAKRGKTAFEYWDGYMEAKKQKLKEQFEKDTSKELIFAEEGSNIFQGISIFVNGYTNPPLSELRRLMMLHGGTYHHYYSRKSTTHIVATNLPYSKIIELKNEKIVKPEWITDSVKAGKLLPDYNYLLYSAPSRGQKTLDMCITSDNNTNNRTEQLTNIYCTSKIHENEVSCENTKLKGNSLPEQVCNKDIPVEKTVPPIEESLNAETTNCPGSIINQTKELSSETSKNSQRNFAASNIKKHNQFSYSAPFLSTEHFPSVRNSSTNFISEFYNHSRLHHISTAKSKFQIYVTELRNCKNKYFTGREKLKELYQNNHETTVTEDSNIAMDSHAKIYMHIDMDCFFASVSLLKYSHLKGKPVAVTHSKTGISHPVAGSDIEYELKYYRMHYLNDENEQLGNDGLVVEKNAVSENILTDNSIDYYGSASEIASCNYQARKHGIHNGMFVGEAKKLCPELHMIPYDFEGYETVSKSLYDIVASYTLDIQAVSCDELYIDCTSVLAETKASPLQFANVLRKEIEEKTGCTASAGLGSNLLLSRLATKTAKPNGQYFIEPYFSEEFMKQQLVKDLPGVGHVLESRLKVMGIKTCEDLQSASIGKLQNEFGMKTGKMLYEYCRGIDFSEIKTENKRKSVSAEINYGMRFQQLQEVKTFLKELAEEVQTRLQKISMRGKSVTLKLKIRKKDAPIESAKYMGHGICDNITKTLQLGSATNNSVTIGRACILLLQRLKLKPEDIRGVGIQVGHLEQLSAKSSSSNKLLLNFIQKSARSNNGERKQDFSYSPLKLHKSETSRSFSEVDPEVFSSLPEYLQHEIIEYYNGNNNVSAEENLHRQEGCFPTTSCADTVRNSFTSKEERNIINKFSTKNHPFGLPNFSQIDHDVLAALPDEVKCEIMAAYSSKERTEELSGLHHPENTLMSLLKQSPSKRKTTKARKSPVPKSSKGNNISTRQSSNRECSITHDAIKKSSFTENENNSHYASKQTKTKIESCKESNLCGAITTDEVKSLLIEWVSSSEAPEEDDIALFSQYIMDIMLEKNLEKLNRIIKYFYRLVKNTESSGWQKSYLDLITALQSTMLQTYGSTLKIETDF